MSKKKIETPVPLDNLISRRQALDYSQSKLGELVGVGQDTISDYELGKTPIPSHILIQLSNILGVSCDYILGLTDSLNIGNKEIEDMTGLTEKSIEQLRRARRVYGSTYGRWVSALNAILENDKIIYTLSDLIYPPKSVAAVSPITTTDEDGFCTSDVVPIFDENGTGTLILNSETAGDVHRQPIAFTLLELSFWEQLKQLIIQLRNKKKEH